MKNQVLTPLKIGGNVLAIWLVMAGLCIITSEISRTVMPTIVVNDRAQPIAYPAPGSILSVTLFSVFVSILLCSVFRRCRMHVSLSLLMVAMVVAIVHSVFIITLARGTYPATFPRWAVLWFGAFVSPYYQHLAWLGHVKATVHWTWHVQMVTTILHFVVVAVAVAMVPKLSMFSRR